MSTLMNKIEHLIKKERTTPEKKIRKDDSKKSSNEILSELFGVFNADPPKIQEVSSKKSKKSKRKHKKDKKKRSRSSSSESNNSDYGHRHKKRKKNKSKRRHRSASPPSARTNTPPITSLRVSVKNELTNIKKEDVKNKFERPLTPELKEDIKPKIKKEGELKNKFSKDEPDGNITPETIKTEINSSDLRHKLDSKRQETANDSEKGKGKIQIKNLKFSAVFVENVKQAEEEARLKAKRYEDGECSDSSSSSDKSEPVNSEFPKSSDPGGILKKQALEDIKIIDDKSGKNSPKKSKESSKKSSHGTRSRSRRRSKSKTRRSRSHSGSRRKVRKRSRSPRRTRSRHRSRSKERSRRSRSRSRIRSRHSPRHRGRRSRSPSRVKLADSEKKRLLEVARRNAINMLKNGAVPAGAAALPPHTRNQVMAAILQSGGKSVDELTDFCKHLSKKEALGELSSVSDDGLSENEDTLAFHHPFLVKEKAPIMMNIRGGAPLPIKTSTAIVANKDELIQQFPVSSGTTHREKADSPPEENSLQVAKLDHKHSTKSKSPLAICDKPSETPPPLPPPEPPYIKAFTARTELVSVPALPAPAPVPPPPPPPPPPPLPKKMDIKAIVAEKLLAIRYEQERSNNSHSTFTWPGARDKSLGQFMGSTGAHILTPKELASGTQAWAKKDQLQRAAPVEGGMGMHLLQKMGWTPGQGLGKEGTGTLQPLLLEVKLDTRGLQAKEEMRSHRGTSRRSGATHHTPLVAGGKHPVSLLGEYCSKQKLGPPEYTLCSECGPDHKKNFLFKVKVASVEYKPAVSSANKKQAKSDSAQLALQKLPYSPQNRVIGSRVLSGRPSLPNLANKF